MPLEHLFYHSSHIIFLKVISKPMPLEYRLEFSLLHDYPWSGGEEGFCYFIDFWVLSRGAGLPVGKGKDENGPIQDKTLFYLPIFVSFKIKIIIVLAYPLFCTIKEVIIVLLVA